jgi:adenosylhomocysteine nucleosidase
MVSRARIRARGMTRVGIIAAMPGELAPLVKGWVRVPTAKNVWRWERQERGAQWIAVCAGIGRDRATKAFAETEKDGALSAVLTIGWAGAIRAGFSAGNAYQVRQIVNSQTGEQFEAVSGGEQAGLVTSARIADEAEKRRLAAAYPGAALVDMEGATVARLAAMRGIPVFCFKAVSDGLEDRLPDMNPFVDAERQFQVARFAANMALRPKYWGALIRFGKNSRKAAAELGKTVSEFLGNEDYLKEGR